MRVRFHPWELDLETAELTCDGRPVRLQPQPARVLVLLTRRAGSLVTREEIQRELWHHQSQVDFDQGLNYCIRQIRLALKDNADEPAYIETIPRRGYRFRAPVETTAQNVLEGGRASRKFRLLRLSWVAPLASVILAVGATAFVMRLSPGPAPLSRYAEITHDGMDKRGKTGSFGGPDAPLATDGSRIYFTEGSSDVSSLEQVSAGGGETAGIPVPFAMPQLLDYSPARSELLVAEHVDLVTEPPLWAVPVPAGSPHRLGDLKARDACWSPDGRDIALIQNREVFLANADGSGRRELASLPGPGWFPRWSPDGKRLRLTVVAPGSGSQSIWEMGSDGANLHPLLAGWNSPHAECCGNWTPDGKNFVFQATRNGKTEVWSLADGPGLSSLLKLASAPVQLTNGQMNSLAPAASRDGKKLYVMGQKLRGELVRYDARVRQFLPYLGGIAADFIAFSRDGEWMAYVDFPNGTLWRSRVDGTERLQLTFPPMEAMVPQWSPDGKRLVFYGIGAGVTRRIYIVGADGGTSEPASSESANEMSPSWSPDGNSVMFSDFPFSGGDPQNVAVHILDLRTKKVSVVPGSAGLFAPRWSPDGRYISASPPGGEGIMIFDFQTQRWEKVADGFGFMNFSADNQYLYFTRHEPTPAILRMRLSNRKVEEAATPGGIREGGRLAGLQFALAPDGAPVLLRDTGTQEIYATDLARR
jgi:Tol biopolymer transport system component/DNA-binding winged helix-turn-helix (wHTH) protein